LSCGSDGCLRVNASDGVLLRRAAAAGCEVAGSVVGLVGAAVAGDEGARRLVDERARMVGIAVSQLADLFDPDSVVLSGSITLGGSIQVETIVATAQWRVRAKVLPQDQATPIAASRFGTDLAVVGAGTLALRDFYSPRLHLAPTGGRENGVMPIRVARLVAAPSNAM